MLPGWTNLRLSAWTRQRKAPACQPELLPDQYFSYFKMLTQCTQPLWIACLCQAKNLQSNYNVSTVTVWFKAKPLWFNIFFRAKWALHQIWKNIWTGNRFKILVQETMVFSFKNQDFLNVYQGWIWNNLFANMMQNYKDIIEKDIYPTNIFYWWHKSYALLPQEQAKHKYFDKKWSLI